MAPDVLHELFAVNEAFNVGGIPEVSVEQYRDREEGIPLRPHRKIVRLPQVVGIKEHPHSASVEPVIRSLDCPRGNTVFFRKRSSTASWNVDKQDVGSGGRCFPVTLVHLVLVSHKPRHVGSLVLSSLSSYFYEAAVLNLFGSMTTVQERRRTQLGSGNKRICQRQ
mmetsp:Transcript_6219/g.15105  ORF Transcript_6219/g.15105 Transcript_6219/m.15105 type:complete len:166 (-) Transcript_6219:35-532(-)